MLGRHPVVITSLEEDFRKIGLLKEKSAPIEESNLGAKAKVGAKALPKGQGGNVGGGTGSKKIGASQPGKLHMGAKYKVGHTGKQVGFRTVEDEETMDSEVEMTAVEEETAFAEAVEFAEEFDAEFDALSEDTEISFDRDEVEKLESLAETVEELPGDILSEESDEDDDDDDDEEDGDDEDDSDDEEDSDDEDDDCDESDDSEEDGEEVDEGEDSDDDDAEPVAEKKGGFPFKKGAAPFKKKGSDDSDDEEDDEDPKAESTEDEDESSVEEESSVQEAQFKRMATGGKKAAGKRKYVKWKRANPGAARKKAMKDKRYHAKASVKNRLKRLKKTARKGFHRYSSLDAPAANLMDSLEELVSGLTETTDGPDASDVFQKVSDIAKQLETLFSSAGVVDEAFLESAKTFTELSQDAAAVVENLGNEDLEVDDDALEDLFRTYVNTLSDGVNAYLDLNETAEFDEESPEDLGKEGNAA